MSETRTARIAALVMCLSTIGLVSAAARQGRDSPPAQAAAPVGVGRGAAAPVFSSPEVMTDKRVVFRIFAPKADEVRLAGTDIPQNREGLVMTKAGNGVWEITVGPLPPGSYRYNFNIDGVPVIDPPRPRRRASGTTTSGAWCTFPAGNLRTPPTSSPARGLGDLLFHRAQAIPPYARLHAAGIRIGHRQIGHGQIPRLLFAARFQRFRRLLVPVGRARFILDNLIAAKRPSR